MADREELTFGGATIPGFVLQGFDPEDPALGISAFHPPGTGANVIITLGLHPRRIVVPMLLVASNFNSYDRVDQFLRSLYELKHEGREQELKVPILGKIMKFEHCYFDGFKKHPRPGIIQDVGTLPGSLRHRWFVEGVATFVQAVVLKTKNKL